MTFRHKLLLFGLTVAAVTALAVFLAGGVVLRASVGDRVKDRLEREVLVLADRLASDPGLLPEPGGDAAGSAAARPGALAPGGSSALRDPCDAFADKTGKSLGLRVTVVARDGRVLGDSALDGVALEREENHAGRPEIVAALREGIGSSVRRSATVHEDLYYVAKRVDRDSRPVGFVRLATAVSEIQRVTGRYSETLALFSFLALLAVAVVGYAAALRFSKPIEEMSLAADAIAAGRRDVEVEYRSEDEIGRLGAALNRMTRALSEQIRALSSEKRLRDTILSGMQEGLLVVDTNRHVLLCNAALRSILGLREQDSTGRPLIEVIRDPAVIRGFDAALLRREEHREIVRAGPESGRSFEVTVSPLTDPDGRQVGAIGLFFDVTRLLALERVRRDFVADVSHELRTPLTSIKAFVETLLSGGLEDAENSRRFLEIVKKHSDRMEAILDDLTDLSLIETGAISIEIERLDFCALAHELVEAVRAKADSLGVAVVSEVPPGCFVPGDRRRVEQILLNLLDNAIKFNRRGGSVTIRAVAGLDTPGTVRVEIEDTGVGVPSDALEKVFHRFYRVDRARSREMGGTGLGLSIVRHLMRLHGGAVRMESQLGRGSRVVLEFPDEPPKPVPMI